MEVTHETITTLKGAREELKLARQEEERAQAEAVLARQQHAELIGGMEQLMGTISALTAEKDELSEAKDVAMSELKRYIQE